MRECSSCGAQAESYDNKQDYRIGRATRPKIAQQSRLTRTKHAISRRYYS